MRKQNKRRLSAKFKARAAMEAINGIKTTAEWLNFRCHRQQPSIKRFPREIY